MFAIYNCVAYEHDLRLVLLAALVCALASFAAINFLNHVRKNKIPLTIFLVNGVKLQGVITWFDNFCLLLRRDAQSQLVYKHAISTIMPGAPIQLFDPEHVSDD